MFQVLFLAVLILVGAPLVAMAALSAYAPRLLSSALDIRRWHRPGLGPRATGRPIEAIAADLHRLLAAHDRIVARSDQHEVHAVRVCQRELHDVAEEAATALGLAPCPCALGGWTTAHLRVRLRQLAGEGFSVPDHSTLGD